MTSETFLEQFSSQYAWQAAPAKRRFRCLKEINKGMRETYRLALTMKGVIDRSLDDLEGLQASDYSTYQIFEGGDLAFKLIDLENIKTSRVGLVPRRGIMSPAYIRLVPNAQRADSRFYAWFFFAVYFNNIFNGMGGGVRQNLTPTDLLEFPIPVPDLATQRRIADFLDRETARIDLLIEKKKRLVALLGENVAAFREANITKGEPTRMKFIANYITSGSRDWGGLYSDEGELFVRIGNVSGNGIDLDLRKKSYVELGDRTEGLRTRLRAGDLLISITADLGSVAVVSQEAEGAYINQHLALVRLRRTKVDPRYVAHAMITRAASDQFALRGNGGTKQGLSLRDVAEISIPLPAMDKQVHIARRIDRLASKQSEASARINTSIDRLKEYRSALITAAVTGQIDVTTYARSGTTDRRLDAIQEEMGA